MVFSPLRTASRRTRQRNILYVRLASRCRSSAMLNSFISPSRLRVECCRLAQQLRGLSVATVSAERSTSAGLRINRCFPQFSRTNVDRLIEAGRVKINGSPAQLGTRLVKGDQLSLDSSPVDWERFATQQQSAYPAGLRTNNGFVYIKYYKGSNVTTTTSDNAEDGILNTGHFANVKFPNADGRLLPVGRLDKQSTGVILLTSDARLPSWLLGANTGCSKVYHVQLDRPPLPQHLQQWAAGVTISTPSSSGAATRSHPTLPCRVKQLQVGAEAGGGAEGCWVEFAIKEGRNRQLRRMVHALGYTVRSLHRRSFCGVGLEGLRGKGDWAPLTEAELQKLRERR